MGNFEILSQSFLNTTSMVTLSTGGSTSAQNLFDRDTTVQFQTENGATETTDSWMKVSFSSTKNISRIILQNMNLKDFRIHVSTVTGAYFPLKNGDTIATNWTGNAETTKYLECFSTIPATAVVVAYKSTIVSEEEKKIGQIWISDEQFTFENNSTAKDYKAKLKRKKVSHEMSDGGNTVYVFGDSFETNLKLKYQSDTMRDNLKILFDTRQPFVFVPYPTGTSWEGNEVYEVNWDGDFEFKQPSGNDYDSLGWSGSMRMKETPK